jgi:hypothetical protein
MTKHNIITGILLLIIGLLLAAHVRQDKQREQRLIQNNNDTQLKLEQTAAELGRSQKLRDSLLLLITVRDSTSKVLSATLKLRDRQIANLKGRYDTVEADSLSKLMESRSASRSGTH